MAADSDWKPASAWTVQCRVVGALILREVKSQFGDSSLGYLWVVIQTGFNIFVLLAIREFLGFHAPHGMGTAVFLLCGFIPWYMFSKTVTRCLGAVNANRQLLVYPQVTELDLMVGRLIVTWGTNIVCALILLSIAVALGQPCALRQPSALAATIFFAPLLGLGMGLIVASLARIWSTVERLVPLVLRVLFLISGLFFQVSELPSRFAQPLLYNPLAQIIEWQRYGFSASSAAPLFSYHYIFVWCFVSLCLGLLLERHVRGRNL